MKWLAAVVLAGCWPGQDYPDNGYESARVVELDGAFHQDPRWLGGDGAYTIDLGDDRTLWLFGDSFIATSPANARTEATLVRNSVAVMTGRDLSTAAMTFAWTDGAPPSSFFAEAADHWFWPSDGVRVAGGALVVFLSEQRPTPGEGLGFASAGLRAVRIADPSGPPATWTIAATNARAPAFAPDANVACSTTVDDHLVALVTDGDAHHGRLARWRLADVAAGELGFPEWWTGSDWTLEGALTAPPAIVIDDGATECSLSFSDQLYGYIYVASRGFGATTVALRSSFAITGPWSAPEDAFTPPESQAPNAFVYAAKGHPMVVGGNANLVVTYADNSFSFADLLDPARAATLYWPHVALITFIIVAC
jgi:hypothetical protein